MIVGTGVDIVKIQRFEHWDTYSDGALAKVFHSAEVARFRFLLTVDRFKAVQFLSSRFAAKEAFFKAFCDFYRAAGVARPRISFLFLARSLYLEQTADGVPVIPSAVLLLLFFEHSMRASISIAHERCCAVSSIVLWEI